MSKWEGKLGDAFFYQDGSNREHLYIVVAEATTYPNEGFGKRLQIVQVNLSSAIPERHYDKTCIVNAGEHPFIKHESYVVYRKMEFKDYQELCHLVNTGVYRKAEPVNKALLQRIVEGISVSPEIPRKFRKLFKL